jgi:hypothetical protein
MRSPTDHHPAHFKLLDVASGSVALVADGGACLERRVGGRPLEPARFQTPFQTTTAEHRLERAVLRAASLDGEADTGAASRDDTRLPDGVLSVGAEPRM